MNGMYITYLSCQKNYLPFTTAIPPSHSNCCTKYARFEQHCYKVNVVLLHRIFLQMLLLFSLLLTIMVVIGV